MMPVLNILKKIRAGFSSWFLSRFSSRRRIAIAAGIMLALALVATGFFFLFGSPLIARYSFAQGERVWKEEHKFELSQWLIAQAIRRSEEPRYYRALSDIQQERLSDILADDSLAEDEQKEQVAAVAKAAIENARYAAEREPDTIENWLALGGIYRLLALLGVPGAAEQGIAAYDRALKINPRLPEAYYGGAAIFLAKGAVETADKALKVVFTLNPHFPDTDGLAQQISAMQ